MRVLLVGGGVTNSLISYFLKDSKIKFTCWEKARGLGGRFATKRNKDGLKADHGAQVRSKLSTFSRVQCEPQVMEPLMKRILTQAIFLFEVPSLAVHTVILAPTLFYFDPTQTLPKWYLNFNQFSISQDMKKHPNTTKFTKV